MPKKTKKGVSATTRRTLGLRSSAAAGTHQSNTRTNKRITTRKAKRDHEIRLAQ